MEVIHEGELGEEGMGSVERRTVGGFLGGSVSGELNEKALCSRSEGSGEDLNSSILSVSGTGSMTI